jgi:hypothetical protein
MPARKVRDVEPRRDGWAVQRTGRADSLHATKNPALTRSAKLAKMTKGPLRVKNRNGQIEPERTYTKDSYPPRG